MPAQLSPADCGIGPERGVGQRPVRRRCSSAQARICRRLRRGSRSRLRTPRCCVRSCAKLEPPGSPRLPTVKSRPMAAHVSPGASSTGPAWTFGHRPVRWWCASAHVRILDRLSRGRSAMLRHPRRWASSRAREEPRFNPRRPARSASSTRSHVSPGAPRTGPESSRGHRPVRLKYSSAHRRMSCSLKPIRLWRFRTPRRSARNRAKLYPAGRPRNPTVMAVWMPFQVSQWASTTGPEACPGHRPVRRWCASAQARICSYRSAGFARARGFRRRRGIPPVCC